jgi:glutamate-1-semialdehyde 2,1-aminomutase
MITLFLQPGRTSDGDKSFPVTNWQTAAQSDTARYARFFWGMIDRGIYFPCSQFEALFFSSMHTDADIEQTIAAAHEALSEVAAGPQ